jgi:hypothetical protein
MEHKRIIRYVAGGEACRFPPTRFYSQTPIAIRKRKCRALMKKHIDCRICSRCKYPFISREGINNCSQCYQDAHDAYRIHILAPDEFKYRVSLYRQWAMDTGYFPFSDKSRSPKYPLPDGELERLRSKISHTMDMMRKSTEAQIYIVRQMPRIIGSSPYPQAQPIPDLRRKRSA